jgi:hypothetical protein
MTAASLNRTERRWSSSLNRMLRLVLAISVCAIPLASAQTPNVKTLGGGRLSPNGPDWGFVDGDILQLSQFHTPSGCAVDAMGRVYVADLGNGAVRRLHISANRSTTLITGLNKPVALALDRDEALYIVTQGDGAIWKYHFGVLSQVRAGLSSPTAIACEASGSLLVTLDTGSVVRVSPATGFLSTVLSGLNRPGGVAVLDSGLIAVSETGGSTIRVLNPASGLEVQRIGSVTAGFADGPPQLARFNQPRHLSKAPGGSLVVADQGNHRYRLVDRTGFVTTLYGVESASWEGPASTTSNPMILPGWLDGSVEFAEAREPAGVAVSTDGKVYTTEVFYHLVREITGANLVNGGGNGSNEPVVVIPPVLTPDSGYFPMGQTISVFNPNSGSFLPSAVYFTTDGSEPTASSQRVEMNGAFGEILWRENMRDLRSLRVRAYLGEHASETVSGRAAASSEIGVPQDIGAGIGSSVVVPIVVNLRTNEELKSLQFRVEVTPESAGAPMIPETFQVLSVSTNDFIPVVTSAQTGGAAQFEAAKYSFGQTRGLAITFIGSKANFIVKDFAVVGMVVVPIPPSAQRGHRYNISVLNPSGTSDGAQQRVPIVAMPARSIAVTSSRYGVGDSSPATWYNAVQIDANGVERRGFGDMMLENSDVNNVFAAALGEKVPFFFSDLFDAMDVFPEDTGLGAGGDGAIRFLDWQLVLIRSLGLDPARWQRDWSDGGIRMPVSSTDGWQASAPGLMIAPAPPGAVWVRQVLLRAESLENVLPGRAYDVPVYVQVSPDCQLSGLAFRATLQSEGESPALEKPLQFIPAPLLPSPSQNMTLAPNAILCGWPLVPSSLFAVPLQGQILLGYIRATIPPAALSGNTYTLRFSHADGSPNLQTQYDFETRPASLWVLSPAPRPSEVLSDEWKLHFFGGLTSEEAHPDADPDQDGVPNWSEYLAGTNPTDARSRLHLEVAKHDSGGKTMALRWLSAPGKRYRLESASTLHSPDWTVLAEQLPGDGAVQQWIHTNATSTTRFYRIRVQQ